MLILELTSFPIEQVNDLAAFEQGLGRWFLDNAFPSRAIGYSFAFNIAPALHRIHQLQYGMAPFADLARLLMPSLRALLAGDATARHPADVVEGLSARTFTALSSLCGEGGLRRIVDNPDEALSAEWLLLGEALETLLWSWPYLEDYATFYTVLAERHLRAATYIIITWEPSDADPRTIIDSLAYATGQPVRRRDRLPAAIAGPVTVDERRARMIPVNAGTPAYAVLRAYAAQVAYDATVLHPLLNINADLAVAIDVQTLSTSQTQVLAETQMGAARVALRTSGGAIDPATEQRAHDAERVLFSQATDAVHQVQVAVLVSGEDAAALDRNVAAVRDRLGLTMRLEAVAGSQAELLRLFSTTPATQIDAAWHREDMLSHGLGCLMGMIGFHRSPSTAGWLWGVDGFRSSPVFIDPFASEMAGHMVILGETGYGKTFFMNLMTIRAAVMAGHRVIWIDAFENAPRIARAVGEGAKLIDLSLDTTLNLLDLVYSPEDGTNWRLMQAQHILNQLALLMGDQGMSGDKRVLIPRVFTKREAGYLERAALIIYDDVPPDAALADMPILSDLIVALEAINETEAICVAGDLRVMLFGSITRTDTVTATGQAFNGHTLTDWNLDDDVTCIDLTKVQRVSGEWLPLMYAQAIGPFYRDMRNPRRDRRRKTLLIIDEFGLAAQIRSVAHMAVTISKVARKYGVALVTADQLPITYLATVEGRQILDNARIKVIFHLDDEPAREIAAVLSPLTPEHVRFITRPAKGECVVVYDATAVPVVVEPSPLELLLLQGS